MAHAYGPPLNHGHPSVSMSTQPSQHPRPRMHSASRSYSYNIPATSVNVMPGHAPPPYARMSATSDPYAAAYSHPHPHPMAFGAIHGPSGVPPRMAKTPGPYGNSAYGGIGVAYAGMGAGVPVAGPLPGWTPPAQYHAPQPSVPPAPQGYGYFQWPSTESVDEIPEDEREHDGYDGDAEEKKGRKSEDAHGVKRSQSVGKKRSGGGLFESLRRKVAGPDVHLHTLLLHARPVPLTWDVRNAPASASRGANSSPAPGAPLGLVLSAHERAQYATSPPRSHMRITCDLMPWSIDVVAPGARGGAGDGSGSGSDSNQQQYITLGHLLDTVHTFLHRRVRRSEWLIANERMQEKVVRAFAWRCYNSPGPRGIEERQGPKRVDWLLKRTVFRGLSRTHGGGEGEEEWELHLGQH